jgi:signal transduction histidine kinase
LLSLFESASGIDLGLDQWLLADRMTGAPHAPGRPAAATSLAIIALACGALLGPRSRWRALMVLLAFLIGYTATLGLLLEAPWAGSLGQIFATVSIPTATSIVMLSAAILGNITWDGTPLERLAEGTAGARLLRAALPLAMLTPAAVLILHHLASRAGWWGPRGGLAIAATLTAVLLIVFAARGALWIDDLQAQLRGANEQLEARVAERTEQLLEAQAGHARAQAMAQARAEFLSRVSHELRTPLNAILGFTQLLLMEGERPLGRKQKEHLDHVVTAGRQLSMLVGDLLDFGHADAGRVVMKRRVEDAFELAQQAAALIGPEAAAAGIAIGVEPPLVRLRVDVDPQRLLQVLANLLSNAVKYNRDGGSVRVTVRRDGGEAVIAVVDTGPGIPAKQLGQLFQPFNRLGREGGPVPGSGIGLALSQRLVGQLDGRIEVSSEAGLGCTFSIHLPALANA